MTCLHVVKEKNPGINLANFKQNLTIYLPNYLYRTLLP